MVLQYEYKLVATYQLSPGNADNAFYKERTEEFLNELGVDGWELCMHGSGHLVFKRFKQS